jgi:endonuclease/exonuclease/phosphatase family metal-dependent hydrolase
MRAKYRLRALLLVGGLCVAGASCAAATGKVRDQAPVSDLTSLSCRQILGPDGHRLPVEVRWYRDQATRAHRTLDAWCRGVGPIVYHSLPANSAGESAPVRSTDAIAVVSWNVNVGAGKLSAFVADLRAGTWSGGRRPEHFVLLLQEAWRTGGAVPPRGPLQAGARRLLRGPPRADIVDVARDLGLSLVYVPSMRNGFEAGAESEDRGNAILSTLPLLAPGAMELPFVRQRRVAVLATLGGLEDGESLGVASVHLDHVVSASRLWLFGAARARGRQARAIATVLQPQRRFVVGGDFNTWLGADEPALREMTRLSNQPAPPREGTYKSGAVLDYLFFRLPASASARYERADTTYGSDHYPLVGWISLGTAT